MEATKEETEVMVDMDAVVITVEEEVEETNEEGLVEEEETMDLNYQWNKKHKHHVLFCRSQEAANTEIHVIIATVTIIII
jgi:hypothetical protein